MMRFRPPGAGAALVVVVSMFSGELAVVSVAVAVAAVVSVAVVRVVSVDAGATVETALVVVASGGVTGADVLVGSTFGGGIDAVVTGAAVDDGVDGRDPLGRLDEAEVEFDGGGFGTGVAEAVRVEGLCAEPVECAVCEV
jgi:hypothetical protein